MKKWLIVYSSNTGNTKQVAEAMLEAAPEGTVLRSVKEEFDLTVYDVIAVGYWVTRGGPDALSKKFLAQIAAKQVVLFQTLGADPGSEHAVTSLARAAYLLGEGCNILGTFSCRGKIDPSLLEKRKDMPKEHPHAPNEQNLKRWTAAAAHPDSADLDKARAFMENIQNKLAVWEKYHAL